MAEENGNFGEGIPPAITLEELQQAYDNFTAAVADMETQVAIVKLTVLQNKLDLGTLTLKLDNVDLRMLCQNLAETEKGLTEQLKTLEGQRATAMQTIIEAIKQQIAVAQLSISNNELLIQSVQRMFDLRNNILNTYQRMFDLRNNILNT